MHGIELFAGPGGMSEGIRLARPDLTMVGLEWDDAACATARAAGHHRVQGDITKLRGLVEMFECEYLHASPPCQGFSLSGKGLGRLDGDLLIDTIRRAASSTDEKDVERLITEVELVVRDPRSSLTLEPLWWVSASFPEYITLEQVPTVRPLWDVYAETLRAWGYSVWSGILNAEQYGVPQTRRRAVLMARLGDHDVHPPVPTHSRYHSRDRTRLDDGVLPWVSMEEALGWGATERPSMTVTGGGARTGGAEPFGNGARQGLRREMEAGRWTLRSNYSGSGPGTAAERGRSIRRSHEPATTITSRPPSFTMTDRPTNWIARGEVPEEWADRVNNQSGGDFDYEALSQTPSPTIGGRGLVSFRGDFMKRSRNDGFRISVEEAAILQSFPAGYPWSGKKSVQYEQVGNAVPPLLGQAVVNALIP